MIDGQTVLPPAAGEGVGIVTYVQPAQRGGHGGILVIDPRWFALGDGRDLHVVIDRDNNAGYSIGSSRDAPAVLEFVPGARYMLGAYAAVHYGGNVTITAGTVFTVYVGDERKIDRCRFDPPVVPAPKPRRQATTPPRLPARTPSPVPRRTPIDDRARNGNQARVNPSAPRKHEPT